MIGTQLGRWVIDAELGRGAMGGVYRAHAADAPDEVRAVKVLAPDLARDELARQRFRRESDVLCHLDHPNIVRFDGAGVDGDTLYYVMEYVAGPDCETRLRDGGRWPWSEVLDLAVQVTRGLKYAHDQGIVHRYLKPANILLQPAAGVFTAKIADFGIARMFSLGALTGSGQFVGTALYMAPEQAAGKPATKRSDFYALGGVLYTLLTGRPPFNGTSLAELVHKHQFVQPERPGRLLVDLPHDIDHLIVQLLSKDPAQRPADGSVLLKRLESIRGKLVRKHNLTDTAFRPNGSKAGAALPPAVTPAPAAEAPPWPSKPVRAAVLAAALLLCVAGIVWAFVRPRGDPEEQYQRAKPLMASANPADWERAWTEHLEPLLQRHPDTSHRVEIEAFRQQMEDHAALRKVAVRARRGGPRSEAQRFYEQGLLRCQLGDVDGGRRVWEQLAAVFADVEAEQRWVRLAQRVLLDVPAATRDPLAAPSLHAALERARALKAAGQGEKAEAIWKGLEELYRDDPTVLAVVRKERAGP